jgi:UrcA family protein
MQRFALAIAATLVFSGLAHSEYVWKVEVSYDDLDLARAEGASTLYTRIQHAAQDVCEVNTVTQPRKLILEHQCVRKAVDDAVHRVDNPNLTSVYLAKAGKRAMVASSR